ncbi:MAG: methyl-accepting chemotaxis protein [Gammaproteobacteria bacterium]|nr:methyl-accepting chemotaxis protein [Gammaproteobacteria bacterium]
MFRSIFSITIRQLFIISAVGFIFAVSFVTLINWMVGETLKKSQAHQQQLVEASSDFLNMRYQVVQIQQFLTDVAASHNSAGFDEAADHRDQALVIAEKLANELPAYQDQISTIIGRINKLHEAGEQMAHAYIDEGQEAGNRLMQLAGTGFDAQSAQLADALVAFSNELTTQQQNASEALSTTVNTSRVVSVGFSVLILVTGMFSYYFTYLKILPPLYRLKDSLMELTDGSGDLTKRLPIRGTDEVGDIIDHFNSFIHLLHDLIKRVANSSMPLTTSSRELAAVSEEARKGALEQEKETHNVASAVNQMSTAIAEVAKHASNTMEETENSNTKAANGHEIVNTTISSINSLASEVTRSAEVIQRLENHSNEIDSILTTIKSIAEQTNLLALNAAIEAARAGEQGRGFAVVADEVRSLAVRTQESTAEIQGMVEQLQQAADEAVEVMNRSHAKAQESVDKAAQAGEALSEITSSVGRIADMSAQIATASEEQSSVAEEINRNITSIDEVTRRSVTLANDTADSANGLVTLSDDLCEMVKQFRI